MIARGLLLLAMATPAAADVTASGPGHFTSVNSTTVARPPADVWKALLEWGRWWNPAHGYSGTGDAFVLEARAGGRLAEDWAGGSVLHATVLNAVPGRLLRLSGGFGPLKALPGGAIMDFALSPETGGTRITLTYRIGGPEAIGAQALAQPVDQVMAEALQRLTAHAQAR